METHEIMEMFCMAVTDSNQMERLILTFRPLVMKKTKSLFFMEKEDAIQELYIALIKAVRKIPYIHSDGECIRYIDNALEYRVKELKKENMNKQKIEVLYDDLEWKKSDINIDDTEFRMDIWRKLQELPEKKKQIVSLSLIGYSDREIGKLLQVSRQYVNRVKRQFV